jgi:thymidylate synthase ThyX
MSEPAPALALADDVIERVAPYCSNRDGDVFALAGLPEEVIAVLFAYYSRSKEDLRTNLARLLADEELAVAGPGVAAGATVEGAADKARAFHEKWVVGYGHSSVAEHACVHLAVERVSILCAKAIEDMRLGSYTEKSTRYVQFSRDSFITPPGLPDDLRALHEKTCADLFDTYLGLFPRVEAGLRERIPRGENQTERGYATAIHAQACDLLRGLLPAATRTNLGVTANARTLAGQLCKMLASPLEEVRSVASAMTVEARAIAPTLVKHVSASEHRRSLVAQLPSVISEQIRRHDPPEKTSVTARSNHVRKVRVHGDALGRVAYALAYEVFADPSVVETLPPSAQAEIVAAAMNLRGKFDNAPRALESSSLTVELTLDYGAFRDMQRHRMLTQHVHRLGAELGAEIPDELETLGVRGQVKDALGRASKAWLKIVATHPDEAQYVVPLAYRVQTLWTLNLRELVHVIELRSARQGHQSYRKIAQRLFDLAREHYPWLAPLIRVDTTEHHPLARDAK